MTPAAAAPVILVPAGLRIRDFEVPLPRSFPGLSLEGTGLRSFSLPAKSRGLLAKEVL